MTDRRPRIAIDARYLRWPGVGISTYLADFVAELAGDGIDATLVTNDPAHARKLVDTFPAYRVDHLPQGREALWEQRALPRYLRHTTPDVYVAGGNRGLPLRSPTSTRLALILHDLIPLRMPVKHLLPDPFAAARFLLGTAISLPRADLIITNSRSTEDEVRRLRPRARTVVRYPSVPVAPAPGGQMPSAWPSEYLLYCGGDAPRRNVPSLLAAHADYRRGGGSLPLVLIGAGCDRLRRRHGDRGSAGDIIFGGLVSEDLKWLALRSARAVLYPSSWEGFGLPILEALSVGTPVLAGYGGAQPEVGGDAVLYVDVHDHESLVRGIHEVADPAWRAVSKQRGPARLDRLRAAHLSAPEALASLLREQ